MGSMRVLVHSFDYTFDVIVIRYKLYNKGPRYIEKTTNLYVIEMINDVRFEEACA